MYKLAAAVRVISSLLTPRAQRSGFCGRPAPPGLLESLWHWFHSGGGRSAHDSHSGGSLWSYSVRAARLFVRPMRPRQPTTRTRQRRANGRGAAVLIAPEVPEGLRRERNVFIEIAQRGARPALLVAHTRARVSQINTVVVSERAGLRLAAPQMALGDLVRCTHWRRLSESSPKSACSLLEFSGRVFTNHSHGHSANPHCGTNAKGSVRWELRRNSSNRQPDET